MRKVNLEKKIDFALKELISCIERDSRFDAETELDYCRYKICCAVSYLCMIDDYVVEEKSTYYCLSEIERNLNNFVEERKRKQNENGDK